MPDSTSQITSIIDLAARGDSRAADQLFALLYDELRAMANAQMRSEPDGITLQGTAIVHEAWIKLMGQDDATWTNRKHFFAAASQAMRRLLVDAARTRQRKKRGGGAVKLELRDDDRVWQQDQELLDLDEALGLLEEHDAEKAAVVKLRYFAGFTTQQVADHLGISVSTAERYWYFARAWLRSRMDADDSGDSV
ncbi:MAG: sigma-70 family RNA polymerase sigma factor [Planctomycetota bacterium]